VPLLSREEEVAIAKEIRSRQDASGGRGLSVPLALHYVMTMAEKLKSGEVEARQVLFDEDDESTRRKKKSAACRVPEIRGAAEALAADRIKVAGGSKRGSAKDVAKRDKKVAGFRRRSNPGSSPRARRAAHRRIVDKLRKRPTLIRSHDRTVRRLRCHGVRKTVADMMRTSARLKGADRRRRAPPASRSRCRPRRSNASPR